MGGELGVHSFRWNDVETTVRTKWLCRVASNGFDDHFAMMDLASRLSDWSDAFMDYGLDMGWDVGQFQVASRMLVKVAYSPQSIHPRDMDTACDLCDDVCSARSWFAIETKEDFFAGCHEETGKGHVLQINGAPVDEGKEEEQNMSTPSIALRQEHGITLRKEYGEAGNTCQPLEFEYHPLVPSGVSTGGEQRQALL
jgi:hypothetical protein